MKRKIVNNNNDEEITRQLIKAKRAVKLKLARLKAGKEQAQQLFEERLMPVAKPLGEIASLISKQPIKQEISMTKTERADIEKKEKIPEVQEEEEANTRRRKIPASPNLEYFVTPEVDTYEIDTTVAEEEEEEDQQGRHSISVAEDSFNEYLDQYGDITKDFVRSIIIDESVRDNSKTGVKFDIDRDKFIIGKSELIFTKKPETISVEGQVFPVTTGLLQLLFFKDPENFTPADRVLYRDILIKSGAIFRNNDPNQQIAGSSNLKYKNIIKPIVSVTPQKKKQTRMLNIPINPKKGSGVFTEYNNNKIDYIHWDDPNELVERLMLLLASRGAGNTAHSNEINSIIEELREADLIE